MECGALVPRSLSAPQTQWSLHRESLPELRKSGRCSRKGLQGSSGKPRPRREPQQDGPRQDSRRMAPPSPPVGDKPMLGLVGGLCSVGASRVGPRAGLLCWLPLTVTCVSSTQMRKLKPGLAAESGREGAGLCLHPGGSPCPLAPSPSHGTPKWEAHIQPPFLRRARTGWVASGLLCDVSLHCWHVCAWTWVQAGTETALLLVLTWSPQQTRKQMFGPWAAEEEAEVWEVG